MRPQSVEKLETLKKSGKGRGCLLQEDHNNWLLALKTYTSNII